MTELGGSRSLNDQWTYVQDTEPVDTRAGVRWIDTSNGSVARVYSDSHGDWMRESRVWVQDTQPSPRVGPLDGDRWIDTSQSDRPSMIYSTSTGAWEQPYPSETAAASENWGYESYNWGTSSDNTFSGSWSFTVTLEGGPFQIDGFYLWDWGFETTTDGYTFATTLDSIEYYDEFNDSWEPIKTGSPIDSGSTSSASSPYSKTWQEEISVTPALASKMRFAGTEDDAASSTTGQYLNMSCYVHGIGMPSHTHTL